MSAPTKPDLEAEASTVGALWGLYFSIYYGGLDDLNSLPRSVQDAYAAVQRSVKRAER